MILFGVLLPLPQKTNTMAFYGLLVHPVLSPALWLPGWSSKKASDDSLFLFFFCSMGA
jgi:hypothetical protein